MDTRRISLDVVRVGTPCDADWSRMPGDDRRRFCDACGRSVHNLSAMTEAEAEAEALVNAPGDRPCIQFVPDAATGRPATLDYAARRTGRRAWLFAVATGAVGGVGAWLFGRWRAEPVPPPVVLGGIGALPARPGEMAIRGDLAMEVPPPTRGRIAAVPAGPPD